MTKLRIIVFSVMRLRLYRYVDESELLSLIVRKLNIDKRSTNIDGSTVLYSN